ncbi:Glucosamine kinase [Usitatibacter rugosus]|uniref:Maltokinase n=1 Tax=Usitatibacter rugosus TaxID=2732067 RepID=A0A6M4GV43_9PROT|nr:maltose alpha-D-glucosyltransferase [Usitatibacter rugosus]QJR11036.1 Glucosamine kinase [Usitatibacter rugosus]
MDMRTTAATDATAQALADWDNPTWYMDAVVYQVHVKAFFDSNDDGIGDFKGLAQKLDYIRDLGVNTIWVMPFYPSPLLDDGYDVADYEGVHPPYGTREDFKAFVDGAHERGLRVITELIVNHTSDQHPWFQAARNAPRGSPKRNYYVWSDDPNKFAGTRIIFTDTESSNWAWDPVAQQHYWHRFFSHQPDLNFDNPHVVKAVLRTMHFWLDMGVDGFRLDAIPYLVEREGTSNENNPETHAVIKQIRADLDKHYVGKLLLAEANMWPEDVRQYFGEGDECHMAYNFPLMPRLYMSIALEDRHPLVEILAQTPAIPEGCQWAIFLRNHDELTLEMVTDRERDYMYGIFASDPRMKVNVGIRRRLAPLMENDREKIELITFLLMTLPGAPILYYGDEIGMGDNIYLGDRNGVRTPMQWSPDRNAGFSRGDPQRLFLPPIMDPVYGFQAVNVEAQLRSTSSLLQWTRRLIAMRARHRAFSRGSLTFLEPGNRRVLAFVREFEGERLLVVVNLARTSQAVELDLSRYEKLVPVEALGGESFPPIGKLPYLLTLPGYGYFAFRLDAEAKPPTWHSDKLLDRRLPVLVLAADWQKALAAKSTDLKAIFHDVTHEKLRDTVLLPWLTTRRWFAAKDGQVRDIRFASVDEWKTDEGSWWLAFLEAELVSGEKQTYFVPLAIEWETRDVDPVEKMGEHSFAKVRRKDRVGVLYGAFGNPEFARAIARAALRGDEVKAGGGTLRFSSTAALAPLEGSIGEEVRIAPLDQSNTSAFLGSALYLKGYRRVSPGVNPELEIGRFLAEASPYAHTPPLVGAMEVVKDKERTTLAILQGYVENQGDLWTAALAFLDRLLAVEATDGETPPTAPLPEMGMELLGQRVAELHRAFGKKTGNKAFDPERVTAKEIQAWREDVLREARATFDSLATAVDSLPAAVQPLAREALGARDAYIGRIESLDLPDGAFDKTRYHGDLHLGQVLLAKNDLAIVDFEGEPARPLGERRRKHSVLRDVAGMLRSIRYASHAAGLKPPALHHPEQSAQRLARWVDESSATFLRGYRAAANGLSSVPKDETAFTALLDLFVAEKALYELRYEMSHRPGWIAIPLRGLLEWTRP